MMFYCYHPSPLGPLLLAADEQGLRLLYMDVHQCPVQADWALATNELDAARRQLDEYFARKREVFDLTLAPVGTANGANPISIIIPCHRVVGSDGTLVGFGGGIENKVKLLELEGSWLI